MRLDIVMPAHNEEQRIDRTLHAYRASCGDGVRLLVALDSCADRTPEIVRAHAAQDRRVPARARRSPAGMATMTRPAGWPRARGPRCAPGLLDRAQQMDKDHPTYYGAAWVALGRELLTTRDLGGC